MDALRSAVIGAGRVGTALGGRWAAAGHEVIYGVRDPAEARHAVLPVVAATADAVRGADVVLIALPWAAVDEALAGLDPGGAVVLDATNPRDVLDPGTSGAEHIARLLGSRRVVKAFNTTGSGNMEDPAYPAGIAPMMALAGDDAEAKALAATLAAELGFDPVDAGPLTAARDLEHLAELWIRLAYGLGNGPGVAFALLRR
jgi:predicted dinucleotide-binding enzyme